MSLPENSTKLLRYLPSVDELVAELRDAGMSRASDQRLTDAARYAINIYRQALQAGVSPMNGPQNGPVLREKLIKEIGQEAKNYLLTDSLPNLRYVINATGVILHTNLGRAPLCDASAESLSRVARGYSNLEYNLSTGQRGKREAIVEKILLRLTGAESTLVVNNNAAAVMFGILVMAEGRAVVVSRGELIEIGGSFRIPDIMIQSGARLAEVGTTNKTRIIDYENAIGPDTALLLKVHTSNFKILGFTEEVSRESLCALGRERGIPVMEDLGSGCFINLPDLPPEPTVATSINAGVDIVTFSGDKLLGGPQAGIAVGKASVIDKMKSHPLMRALRPDKLTLAALEATLRAYLDPERALEDIPALRMLVEKQERTFLRAESLMGVIGEEAVGRLQAKIVDSTAVVGGGAMPLAELKSTAISLSPQKISVKRAEARLRDFNPPIICRIEDDRIILDMRCVIDGEIDILAAGLHALANSLSENDPFSQ